MRFWNYVACWIIGLIMLIACAGLIELTDYRELAFIPAIYIVMITVIEWGYEGEE